MLQFLEASAGADAASLVTTVTGMVGVPIAGVVIGLVGRLMRRH